MEKKRRPVQINIDQATWNRFSSKCRKNGTTMTQVFIAAIHEYLKKGGKS